MAKEYRVNEKIRSPQVRIIGNQGEQVGIMSLKDALAYARERDLDLVEVAPTAVPPVCRVLDYGRLKYLQAKKEREARKGHKAADLRELKVRPRINDYHLDLKIRTVRKLLDDGDKVKVSVLFRGREQAHPELGIAILRRIAEELKSEAKLESPPTQEGRALNIVLMPVPKQRQPARKGSEDAKDKNP